MKIGEIEAIIHEAYKTNLPGPAITAAMNLHIKGVKGEEFSLKFFQRKTILRTKQIMAVDSELKELQKTVNTEYEKLKTSSKRKIMPSDCVDREAENKHFDRAVMRLNSMFKKGKFVKPFFEKKTRLKNGKTVWRFQWCITQTFISSLHMFRPMGMGKKDVEHNRIYTFDVYEDTICDYITDNKNWV